MTVTRALLRKKAQAMMRDPLYRELRGWHFGLGAKEALATVRGYDDLMGFIKGTRAPSENMQRVMDEELWK